MAENTNNRRNTYREGLEYEAFVATLFHAVHTADDLTANLTTTKLERNKRIRNRYGFLYDTIQFVFPIEHLSAMNNEVFIEDGEDRYSLQELAGRLSGEGFGRVQETREFSNAFIVYPTHGRLKMRSFTIDYSTFPPMTEKIEMDGAAALLGVIEYVQKGEKKLVFKNRDQEKIVTRKLTV